MQTQQLSDTSQRQCSSCELTKPLLEFPTYGRRCRACESARIRDSRRSPEVRARRAEQARLDRRLYPEVTRDYDRNKRVRARSDGTVPRDKVLALDILSRFYGPGCLFPDCDRMNLEFDHVLARSQGGIHSLTNGQPLCREHNMSKYSRLEDYRGEDQYTSLLRWLILDGGGLDLLPARW